MLRELSGLVPTIDDIFTLDQYQTATQASDMSPGTDWYYALGLNGEAGEVAELLKKAYRGGYDVSTESLLGELGDVLWYLARLGAKYNLTLGEIARYNVAKLKLRMEQGRITG